MVDSLEDYITDPQTQAEVSGYIDANVCAALPASVEQACAEVSELRRELPLDWGAGRGPAPRRALRAPAPQQSWRPHPPSHLPPRRR